MVGKNKRVTIFSLVLIGWLMVFPEIAQAKVVVNEVYPNPPGSSETDEWVELYNTGPENADLSGFQITDIVGKAKTYGLGSTLPAGQYLIIERSESQIILNNDADGVKLLGPDGQTVDEVNYEKAVPEGKTFGRIADGGAELNILNSVTKGTSNGGSAAMAQITEVAQVKLSEVFPCPETSGEEWVELKNHNSKETILNGWFIEDTKGNKRPVSVTIPPNGYKIISWPSGFLNNDGDSVRLINAGSEIIDSMSYDKCAANQSMIIKDNQWLVTTTATPNGDNVLNLPSPTASKSITATIVPTRSPTAKPNVNEVQNVPTNLAVTMSDQALIRLATVAGTQTTATDAGVIDMATMAAQLNTQTMAATAHFGTSGWWLMISGLILAGIAGWPVIKQSFLQVKL